MEMTNGVMTAYTVGMSIGIASGIFLSFIWRKLIKDRDKE